VDIETTAGASGDRIAEVGAVRIRNPEVIEEWYSLINPQRPIPAGVVPLTGITKRYGAWRPSIRRSRERFMEFMSDGIFVARSVNFDYGFTAHEYEHLERRFRYPKLCTCASMRRHYPGHKSYSLGNLCDALGI
jgi:DNA polymerase III subunit epsilon